MKHQTVVAMLAQANVPQFVVLDGFEGIWDNNELRDRVNQILHDIHNIPHLMLLLTLRGSTVPSVVDWTYRVGPLPTQDARDLFIYTNPYCADAGLNGLLEKVDFNPALVGVLARIGMERKMRPEEMLTGWEDRGIGILDEFPEEKRAFCSSVESSLKSIMESNPAEWKLLKILSMFPCGLPLTELFCLTPEIHEVAPTDFLTLDPISHVLKLHAPIQSYIFQTHHLEDSISGLYSYVFHQCKTRVSRPGDAGFIENVAYLTTFGSNLEFILADALDRGCIDAIEAFLDYSAHLCYRRPNERIVTKAIALARRHQRKEQLARCLQCSAEMHRVVNGSAENEFEEPTAIFMELNDTISAAYCEHGWGLSKIRCGYEGLGRINRALEMFRAFGDEQGEAQCLLSIFQATKGDRPYDYLHKAKDIFIRLDDQFRVAQCLQEEADSVVAQGRIEEGFNLLLDAANKFTRVEDGFSTAECFHELGRLIHALGDEKSCYEYMDRALKKYQSLGRTLDAAFCMKDLATRYWSAGRFLEAISLQEPAVKAFWEFSYVYGGAETRLELGMSQIAAGRIRDAIMTLEIAKRENQRTERHAAVQISTSFLRLCQEAQSIAARSEELQRISQEKLSTMTSWADAKSLLPYLDVEAVQHLRKFN